MNLQGNSTLLTSNSKASPKSTTHTPPHTTAILPPDESLNDVTQQYPTNLLVLIVIIGVIAVIIAIVLLIRRKMRMDRLRNRLRPVYRFRASEEELLFERNDFLPKQMYFTFENNMDFYNGNYPPKIHRSYSAKI
ncbi:uncharacterized protein LOC120351788 [Nilaparvata lugens]|uniref:uncharacterized protein LOC120351788 n=1 Tax=Nilaparvata lugens TaxID=108931 RepID=UPI00193E24EA|nr:uncharacterized protein LOC120351788 [Nilaparvata lugens]